MMSRRCRLVARTGVLAACLACTLAIAAPATGQQNRAPLHDLLAMEIETKDFQEPMPLKQAMLLLSQKFAAKGLDLSILIDAGRFAKPSGADAVDIGNDEVHLPYSPKVLTTGKALQLFISQVKTAKAAMLLRNGMVEIVPQADATPAGLLRSKVQAHFEKTPLVDAVRRLSYLSGASIMLDPRLKETAQTPITADFRGDLSLESALRSVADMADVRIVPLTDGGIYVTTPANAEVLEKQIRPRRQEPACDNATSKAKSAAK